MNGFLRCVRRPCIDNNLNWLNVIFTPNYYRKWISCSRMIPNHERLPVNLLAASFNNTAPAYKFYWFLAILEEVENGHCHIPKQRIFVGMVAASWYTINYFHISFGKQDQLHDKVKKLQLLKGLVLMKIETGLSNAWTIVTYWLHKSYYGILINRFPTVFQAPGFHPLQKTEMPPIGHHKLLKMIVFMQLIKHILPLIQSGSITSAGIRGF